MNNDKRVMSLGVDQDGKPVMLKFPNSAEEPKKKQSYSQFLVGCLVKHYMSLAKPASKHRGGWAQHSIAREEKRAKSRLQRRARRVMRLNLA